MTEFNKDSLELYIYKKTGGLHDPRLVKKFISFLQEWLKTGGLHDPRLVKKFISLLQEWLPPVERGTTEEEKMYYSGYNAYKGQILENLWWNKK